MSAALSCEPGRRLPVTFAALAAGKLGPVHVQIIEDVTYTTTPTQYAA